MITHHSKVLRCPSGKRSASPRAYALALTFCAALFATPVLSEKPHEYPAYSVKEMQDLHRTLIGGNDADATQGLAIKVGIPCNDCYQHVWDTAKTKWKRMEGHYDYKIPAAIDCKTCKGTGRKMATEGVPHEETVRIQARTEPLSNNIKEFVMVRAAKYNKDSSKIGHVTMKDETLTFNIEYVISNNVDPFYVQQYMEKECTFVERPLGLCLYTSDNKIFVKPYANKNTMPKVCQKEGIVADSQILSVNGESVIDMSEEAVCQLIGNTKGDITISFSCPVDAADAGPRTLPPGFQHALLLQLQEVGWLSPIRNRWFITSDPNTKKFLNYITDTPKRHAFKNSTDYAWLTTNKELIAGIPDIPEEN